MNRSDDISKLIPPDGTGETADRSVDLEIQAKKKQISRRRVVLALSLSLLGGILLIWLLQDPPEDAVESHAVHIQPAVAESGEDTGSNEMLEPGVVADGSLEQSRVTEPGQSGTSAASTLDPAILIEDVIRQSLVDAAKHPLDPVLMVAKILMDEIDERIDDYSCVITSQAFVDGRLDKERRMRAKVRHAKEVEGEPKPFSVYLEFLSPRSLVGQEVIWVEGQNDGKLIAHVASGFLRLKRMHLTPDGPIAMRGSRYPISDIGFRNLIEKMYEIGSSDRKDEDCQVIVTPGVKVEGRPCTLIEIKHEQKKEIFQFHIAKIYVDNERKIPIGYEAYSWPSVPGQDPPLVEKFYYTDMNLNVGLKDSDFDPDNPDYLYPSW